MRTGVPFESFRAEIEAAVLTPVARSDRAKLRDHIESQRRRIDLDYRGLWSRLKHYLLGDGEPRAMGRRRPAGR
jgi:hypothetical protein